MASQGGMKPEGTDRGTDRPSRKERRRNRQLQREQEGRRARRRATSRRWLVRGGIAAGCLAVAGGTYWLWAQSDPPLPRVGDHWHAAYEVVLCGKPEPQLAFSPGNIHTHGDGQIHIHPGIPEEGGKNSTLNRFFANSRITFSNGTLRYPDGRTYRHGDACPDGRTGRLRLLVNGTPNPDLERYVPRDGDRIRVEFGPE